MPYAPLYGDTWENCFTHPRWEHTLVGALFFHSPVVAQPPITCFAHPSYDKEPAVQNVSHAFIEGYVAALASQA